MAADRRGTALLQTVVRRLLPALLAAGCAAGEPDAPATVTVLLPSSLLGASRDLSSAFREPDTTVNVQLQVMGTPALVTALERGGAGSVLVTADKAWMDYALERGLVGAPAPIATSRVVMVASTSGVAPDLVRSPVNLATPGVRVALAGPDVPLGRYARELLASLATVTGYGGDFAERVAEGAVAEEPSAEAVLLRLQRGEADAAIIFRSALASDSTGAYREVPLPVESPRATWYAARVIQPDSVVQDSSVARQFLEFLQGERGQRVLERHGFDIRGGLKAARER